MKLRLGYLLMVLFFGKVAMAAQPFVKSDFESAQKSGENILLHFHAEWCPTCKIQQKHLVAIEKKGGLKGVRAFTVDYDKETEFKKDLKVTSQSTFVAYKGSLETGRNTGITNEKAIADFIDKFLVNLPLETQLDLMKKASIAKLPPEKRKVMDDATERLRASHLAEKSLKVGQEMPNFVLPNMKGTKVELKALLKEGPVIVTFYRGGWCPYCNAQLASYQKHLADFRKKGARLVAITPEKPDLTTLTKEQKKIEFEILSDVGNMYSSQLGLVFGVPEDLKKLYLSFGIDLEKSQGNPDWQLPVAATYVVNKEGKIIFAFADADYTRRASPEEILKILK